MHKFFLMSFSYKDSEKMHKSFLMNFSDKRDDRRTAVQRYRPTYIYPLDKRYSPIIALICGPKKVIHKKFHVCKSIIIEIEKMAKKAYKTFEKKEQNGSFKSVTHTKYMKNFIELGQL